MIVRCFKLYEVIFARLIVVVAMLGMYTSISASTPLAKAYINTYKDIAVQEMKRTGIPASIKLAQGLLESDWGRSDLAKKANNHFGIKCGGQWEGGVFYKEDDDRDDRGKLIPSCFRVFDHAQHSYVAHSEFLRDPNKQYRYGFLFDLPSNDYTAWARGLLDAGYATDKRYPEKLITIIERYSLSDFDEYVLMDEPVLADQSTPSHIPSAAPISRYQPEEKHGYTVTTKQHGRLDINIEAINRVAMVEIHQVTTLEEVAAAVGLNCDLLVLYNDGIYHAKSSLQLGDIVYLEKKKRSYIGTVENHIVQEGESMMDIAQQYGIRLRNLYAKNRMPQDAIPLVGEKLQLRRSAELDERPVFTREDSQRLPKEFLEEMTTKGEFTSSE